MLELFSAELKKLIRLNRLLLIVAIALVVRTVLCLIPSVHDHPYSEEVYKSYNEKLGGELTDEKTEYLNARLAEIEELIASYDEMQQRYTGGEIGLDEYFRYTELHGKAKAEESTVRYLVRKCGALNACTDFKKQLFYDTDWSGLFEDNGFDIVMLLALLCIAVPAFDCEYFSSSYAQILTSKRGKTPLALSKLAAVIAVVFLLSLMMSGARLGVFAYRNGLDYSDMPVGNVLLTDGFGSTTLLGYFLTDALLKALVWGMYSVIVCLIAVLCRNVTFAFVIGFIVGLTPKLISTDTESSGIFYLISGSALGEMYPATLSLWVFVGVTVIKAALISIGVVMAWGKKDR